MKKRFPIFAIIILVIGLVWMLNDLNVFRINLPWIPSILVIAAIGMIINRYSEK
ncbi:MAG: hypothetical protein AABX07_03215 [Nanoarchaeota archaeon]